MFSGVPNMAWVFGYFRASWTLRADLLGDFVCRLLQHMDAPWRQAWSTPGSGMALRPWWIRTTSTRATFNAAYTLPRQGDCQPWLHLQDYAADKDELPRASLDDGTLVYG